MTSKILTIDLFPAYIDFQNATWYKTEKLGTRRSDGVVVAEYARHSAGVEHRAWRDLAGHVVED